MITAYTMKKKQVVYYGLGGFKEEFVRAYVDHVNDKVYIYGRLTPFRRISDFAHHFDFVYIEWRS
ncbi:coil containing protein [Vibrio phage 1.047.O._10N.286.55.F2]|nr:coil containing protein [Vibrio phage 1.047.O._10N.286.55.F2]